MVDSDKRDLLGRWTDMIIEETKGGLLGPGLHPRPIGSHATRTQARRRPTAAPPQTTSDISDADSAKLVRFCRYQMAKNPAGIGNECTHFVYAGLFEIGALDGTVAIGGTVLVNNQGNFQWGREITSASARAGDIVQFRSHNQAMIGFHQDQIGWLSQAVGQARGPDHTGILAAPPIPTAPGGFHLFECHLHHAPEPAPVMQIRIGHIIQDSFALQLPMTNPNPANKNMYDFLMKCLPRPLDNKLLYFAPYYQGRAAFGVSPVVQAQFERQLLAKTPPGNVAGYYRATVSGAIRFFRPQISIVRGGMNTAQRAAEKQRVIAMITRSGRVGSTLSDPGNPASSTDQYNGDSRADRIADGRFDWTFVDTPPSVAPTP